MNSTGFATCAVTFQPAASEHFDKWGGGISLMKGEEFSQLNPKETGIKGASDKAFGRKPLSSLGIESILLTPFE